MDLTPIISRIDTQATQIRLVQGAAQLAALMTAPSKKPAAWVVPLGDSARANQFSTATIQEISVRFGVVICTREASDATGDAALDALEPLRQAVMDAIHGWQPTAEHKPIEYAAGRLLQMAGGLLWWQDEFLTAYEKRTT
jgi:hypothetical protein